MILIIFKFVVFVGLAIGGFLLTSKFVDNSKMEVHKEVAGFIYAVLGVIYAVVLAFVVIVVWEDYTDAEKNIHAEVSYIVDIYRNSNAFPGETSERIQSACINYMEAVIGYEWPAMAHRKISDEALNAYLSIWKVHQTFTPETTLENHWYAESIKELNKLADVRRYRIFSIHYDIAPIMWTVLIFGAFITISFCYLFGTKNKIAHGIMICSLASVICLILILIDAMEHPFSGYIHLTPDAFVMTMEQLKEEAQLAISAH
jgi:hypothetical protein